MRINKNHESKKQSIKKIKFNKKEFWSRSRCYSILQVSMEKLKFSSIILNILACCFSLERILQSEVLKKLKELSCSKAAGSDNMQVCFLRDAAEAICPFLTHIVNLSIIWAKFPTEHVQRLPYVHYAHGECALPKIKKKKKKICGRLTQINKFLRIARNCGWKNMASPHSIGS